MKVSACMCEFEHDFCGLVSVKHVYTIVIRDDVHGDELRKLEINYFK